MKSGKWGLVEYRTGAESNTGYWDLAIGVSILGPDIVVRILWSGYGDLTFWV